MVNGTDARAGTQLDVVIQTGAGILASNLAVTGEVREDVAEHIEGLMDGPDTGIGAKIL